MSEVAETSIENILSAVNTNLLRPTHSLKLAFIRIKNSTASQVHKFEFGDVSWHASRSQSLPGLWAVDAQVDIFISFVSDRECYLISIVENAWSISGWRPSVLETAIFWTQRGKAPLEWVRILCTCLCKRRDSSFGSIKIPRRGTAKVKWVAGLLKSIYARGKQIATARITDLIVHWGSQELKLPNCLKEKRVYHEYQKWSWVNLSSKKMKLINPYEANQLANWFMTCKCLRHDTNTHS